MQRCKAYKEDYVAEAVLQKMRSKRLEVENGQLKRQVENLKMMMWGGLGVAVLGLPVVVWLLAVR